MVRLGHFRYFTHYANTNGALVADKYGTAGSVNRAGMDDKLKFFVHVCVGTMHQALSAGFTSDAFQQFMDRWVQNSSQRGIG